jgi:predicted nucleotidyltransferase
MRPSEALAKHREEVLEIISRYPVSNPRVFGSVARGEDVEGSDVDILVEPQLEVTTFAHLGALEQELSELLGHEVVWKCVEVLGEAAGKILKIDPAFAVRYPDLQLKSAYAMRNQLTHGYGVVDLGILWRTIHDFTPRMVAAARDILEGGRGKA